MPLSLIVGLHILPVPLAAFGINQLDGLDGSNGVFAADDADVLAIDATNDVLNDFIVVGTGTLILSIRVRPIQPLSALGQRKAFDIPVLDAVQVLPPDLDDAALADQRDAAFEILV